MKENLKKLDWKKMEAEVFMDTVDNVDRFIIKCTECQNLLSLPLTSIQALAKQYQKRTGAMYA